jgi:hypothetical protein
MRSMLASRLVLVCALASACGGSKQEPTEPQAGSDGDQSGCERGRCLEDISKAIAERRDDSRTCYEQGRTRDPKMEGKIIINFAIDASGAVGETSQGMQDGQIEEAGVVDCLSEVIKTVRFAPSAKGKTTRAYHRFELAP